MLSLLTTVFLLLPATPQEPAPCCQEPAQVVQNSVSQESECSKSAKSAQDCPHPTPTASQDCPYSAKVASDTGCTTSQLDAALASLNQKLDSGSSAKTCSSQQVKSETVTSYTMVIQQLDDCLDADPACQVASPSEASFEVEVSCETVSECPEAATVVELVVEESCCDQDPAKTKASKVRQSVVALTDVSTGLQACSSQEPSCDVSKLASVSNSTCDVSKLANVSASHCDVSDLAQVSSVARLAEVSEADCSDCDVSKLASVSTSTCEVSKLANVSASTCDVSKLANVSSVARLTEVTEDGNKCDVSKLATVSTSSCDVSKLANVSASTCDVSKLANVSSVARLAEVEEECSDCDVSQLASVGSDVCQLAEVSSECSSNDVSKLALVSNNKDIQALEALGYLMVNEAVEVESDCCDSKQAESTERCESAEVIVASIDAEIDAMLQELHAQPRQVVENVFIADRPQASKTALVERRIALMEQRLERIERMLAELSEKL
jgi:hypothetical protein